MSIPRMSSGHSYSSIGLLTSIARLRLTDTAGIVQLPDPTARLLSVKSHRQLCKKVRPPTSGGVIFYIAERLAV